MITDFEHVEMEDVVGAFIERGIPGFVAGEDEEAGCDCLLFICGALSRAFPLGLHADVKRQTAESIARRKCQRSGCSLVTVTDCWLKRAVIDPQTVL
jgi:hypothetical protein